MHQDTQAKENNFTAYFTFNIMREFVNEFQSVYKITPDAPSEAQDIKIKDYNSITIINNTIGNIIQWDNAENYILPNGVVNLRGDTDQFITGTLRIIMDEALIGFPPAKVVLIKKRYNNATV
jgi:hypothetical protein